MMKKTINAADPRVKRTRKLLQETLMALLIERDFAAITVQDIVTRATVNRTTFYAHFEDKYALMDALLRDYFRQDVIGKLEPTAPFTAATLQALVVAVFAFLAQFERCRPQVGTALPLFESAVQCELQCYLTAWLNRQTTQLPDGQDPGTLSSALLSWAIWGAGVQWSRQPARLPVHQVAPQVVALLLHGYGAPFGAM